MNVWLGLMCVFFFFPPTLFPYLRRTGAQGKISAGYLSMFMAGLTMFSLLSFILLCMCLILIVFSRKINLCFVCPSHISFKFVFPMRYFIGRPFWLDWNWVEARWIDGAWPCLASIGARGRPCVGRMPMASFVRRALPVLCAPFQ